MPSGPATNKTEFARYLNDHPDAVASLRQRAAEYRLDPRGRSHFGQWLHAKHHAEFVAAYEKWWLHHPAKFSQVYDDCARQNGIPMTTSRL